MECPRCKRVINSNEKYCHFCGEPLNDKRQNRIRIVTKWILNPFMCYFAIIVMSILLNGTFYRYSTHFEKCTFTEDDIEGVVSSHNIQPILTKLPKDGIINLRTDVKAKIPILFPGFNSTQNIAYGLVHIKIEKAGNSYVALGTVFAENASGEYEFEVIDECTPKFDGENFTIDENFVSRMIGSSIEEGLNDLTKNIKEMAFYFSLPFIFLCLIRIILMQFKRRYCINCGYKNKYLVDTCSNCGASMKGIEQKKIEKKLMDTSSCSKPIINTEIAKILAIIGIIIVAIGIFWIYNENQKQNRINTINSDQSNQPYQVPFTGRNGACRHSEPYTGERCKCAEYRAGVSGKCSYCGHSFTEHE